MNMPTTECFRFLTLNLLQSNARPRAHTDTHTHNSSDSSIVFVHLPPTIKSKPIILLK